MSAADIACYAAKDAGRNRIHVYEADGVSHRHREMHWVARVTRAAEENRLELFFQPHRAARRGGRRTRLSTSSPCGCATTTARWCRPSEFIPAAERYNVMSVHRSLGGGQAIELLRERQRRGRPLPLLAVNLSGTSLNEQSFVDFVLQSVDRPGDRRRAVLRDHRDRGGHQSFERDATSCASSRAAAAASRSMTSAPACPRSCT